MRLKALYDLIMWYTSDMATCTADVIILGDLNAAGSYVKPAELKKLLQFLKFHDTIGPVDSTTRNKGNAYDKCATYLT